MTMYKIGFYFGALVNEEDKMTMCKIGFYFGALLCAELHKKMPMLHIDQYKTGLIRYIFLTNTCYISWVLIRINNKKFKQTCEF